MKTYRTKKSTLVFTLGFLALITAVTIFGIFYAEPRAFFVALLAVLAFRWYQILKSPAVVVVRDDGVIEFRSPLGRLPLRIEQIKQIKRVGGGYWLEHQSGSLNLYGNMEGIKDLLSQLQAANPALEVKPYTPWGKRS